MPRVDVESDHLPTLLAKRPPDASCTREQFEESHLYTARFSSGISEGPNPVPQIFHSPSPVFRMEYLSSQIWLLRYSIRLRPFSNAIIEGPDLAPQILHSPSPVLKNFVIPLIQGTTKLFTRPSIAAACSPFRWPPTCGLETTPARISAI